MEHDGEVEFSLVDLQGSAFHPSWSPDGGRIAYFVREVGSMTCSPWVPPVERGQVGPLGEFEGVMKPAWSPDGSQLMLAAGQHPTFSVVVVHLMDGTVTLLAEGSDPALAHES